MNIFLYEMLKIWKAVKVEAQLPYKFDANEHSGISRLPKMFFDGLNMIQALLLYLHSKSN